MNIRSRSMKSIRDWPLRSARFTRRTATVTMSAPEAACAWAITACDEYLPVPTMRREAKVRPAMTNGSLVIADLHDHRQRGTAPALTAADEVHDLDLVALGDHRRVVGGALDHELVALDGHAPCVDVELRQQRAHAQRLGEIVRVAVQSDGHSRVEPVATGPLQEVYSHTDLGGEAAGQRGAVAGDVRWERPAGPPGR